MKKITTLGFVAATLIFGSCSNDRDNNENNSNSFKKVISKIAITYYDNPSNPETDYAQFFYTNGVMSKTEYTNGRYALYEYDPSGKYIKSTFYKNDNTVEYTTLNTYTGDLLTSSKSIYTNTSYNRYYTNTYNANSQLTSLSLCQSQENCTSPSIRNYSYLGNNVANEIHNGGSYLYGTTKREYTYDNKKNPYSYASKHMKSVMGGADVLSENNYISEKISSKNADGTWTVNQNISYQIQYDADQFPTEILGKDSNGNNYVKYKYEYIVLN